jgi:hypothetical protein
MCRHAKRSLASVLPDAPHPALRAIGSGQRKGEELTVAKCGRFPFQRLGTVVFLLAATARIF